MPKTTNTRLYDESVRHQIDILRYGNGELHKLVGMFNRAAPSLLSAVSDYDPSDAPGVTNQARLNNLIAAVDVWVDALFKDINETLDSDIKEFGDAEAEREVNKIDHAVPLDLRRGIKARKPAAPKPRFGLVLGTPTTEQVYASVHARPFQGKLLNEWYAGLTDSVKQTIRSTIRQGYVDGLTTDAIVRNLRGTRSAKFTDGVLQQSRRSIERTVRTALNHTANVAREQVYKKNNDLISGVRWVSTLDTRTSETCIALDGQTFPVDEGPRPPAHLNCRSCTTPIIKSWRELGFDIDELPEATRASMDGQVPESETYGSWLKRQSAETQTDVLGASRAALFRDGGLTVDKFVDEAGRSLTLDQLRAREASAFDKADI